MEGLSFAAVVDVARQFILEANERAANLDGRAAFVLGLLTWFAVEQAIRRLAGVLRIAIIVAALGATGFGAVALLDFLDEPAQEQAPAPSSG
jgi:hypothetical protein